MPEEEFNAWWDYVFEPQMKRMRDMIDRAYNITLELSDTWDLGTTARAEPTPQPFSVVPNMVGQSIATTAQEVREDEA